MNHKNTWGVLDYKKDMNQYDTPASPQVDAKMQLAFVDTEHRYLVEPEVGDEEEEGVSSGSGVMGGDAFYEYKNRQMQRALQGGLLRPILEERERLDAQEEKKSASAGQAKRNARASQAHTPA